MLIQKNAFTETSRTMLDQISGYRGSANLTQKINSRSSLPLKCLHTSINGQYSYQYQKQKLNRILHFVCNLYTIYNLYVIYIVYVKTCICI